MYPAQVGVAFIPALIFTVLWFYKRSPPPPKESENMEMTSFIIDTDGESDEDIHSDE